MIEKLNLKPITEIKLRLAWKWLSQPPFTCPFNRFVIIHSCFKEIDKKFK